LVGHEYDADSLTEDIVSINFHHPQLLLELGIYLLTIGTSFGKDRTNQRTNTGMLEPASNSSKLLNCCLIAMSQNQFSTLPFQSSALKLRSLLVSGTDYPKMVSSMEQNC